MKTIIIKKRSPLIGLVTALLVIHIARIIILVVTALQDDGETSVFSWAMAALSAVVLVVCILLFIRMRRSQLALEGGGMVYTPLLGPKKEMSYSDIQKLSMGGRSYVMYNSEGKKFFTFDDFRTQNASEIVAFLKAKGVRTEI